jgi:hypothetical protein
MALIDISSEIAALQATADTLTTMLEAPGVITTQAQAQALGTISTYLEDLANVATEKAPVQATDPELPATYGPGGTELT